MSYLSHSYVSLIFVNFVRNCITTSGYIYLALDLQNVFRCKRHSFYAPESMEMSKACIYGSS